MATDTGNDMITVTIKQLDGQSFSITCSQDATVLGLKTMIMEEKNITMNRQRLIYRARELIDNEKLLSDYSVSDGSVLHIVIRPDNAEGPPPPAQNVAIEMQPQQHGWGEPGFGGQGIGGMGGRAAAGGMERETFETFRLSRFVKIFAIIDTVFLFLYGISTHWLCFVLALFAMGGVYGAMKLRKHLLILYMICLVLEIVLRCVIIYAMDSNTIDVILFVIMILIDAFVMKCTIQLYKRIGTLTPQQIDMLITLNNRCF